MRPEPATLHDLALRYTAAWCSQDAARVAGFYSPSGWLSVNGVRYSPLRLRNRADR